MSASAPLLLARGDLETLNLDLGGCVQLQGRLLQPCNTPDNPDGVKLVELKCDDQKYHD